MWQFPTIAAAPAGPTVHLAEFTHLLTHRRYRFTVLLADAAAVAKLPAGRPRKWLTLDEIDAYPLPRPQQKVAELLAARALRPPGKGPAPTAAGRRPR
jgi:hypothetical protein